MSSPVKKYRDYTSADKAALKELKAEVEGKIGKSVELAEMISAVEPELDTPAHLANL